MDPSIKKGTTEKGTTECSNYGASWLLPQNHGDWKSDKSEPQNTRRK